MNAYEKCAMVIMTLEDEAAAAVLRHFEQHEVEKVSAAMVAMTRFTRLQLMMVLTEFQHDVADFSDLPVNSREHVLKILSLTMGAEKADNLMEDLRDNTLSGHQGIETLNEMDAQDVSALIGDEHPQIIATILVHLQRRQSADILACLEESLRHDVMLRIAKFGGVQPVALQTLTESLNRLLEGQYIKRSKMGGIRPVAEILNLLSTPQETSAINAVHEFDQTLARKIIDEMFSFDNLANMDDRSVQRILQEIDSESLILALKGAEQPVRDKCFRNMSRRQAEILSDELQSHAPVRLSVVDTEQKKIIQIMRTLEESGEISLVEGDDIYV